MPNLGGKSVRCEALVLASLMLVAGCKATRAPGSAAEASGVGSLVLEVLTMTHHRQRVELVLADARGEQPAITATADLPAHTTSKDFAGLLAFIVVQQGFSAHTRESDDPAYAPASSEELQLGSGLVVTQASVKKKVGDEWLESGPDDLRLHLGEVRSER